MLDETTRKLLLKLGRASTPSVARNPFGIRLSKLLESAEEPRNQETLVLITEDMQLMDALCKTSYSVTRAIPNCLIEQVKDSRVKYFLVDSSAFDSGPWYGTANGGNHHLAFQIGSAAQQLVKTGGISMLRVTPAFQRSAEFEYLSRFFNVISGKLDIDQLEEGARQSDIWDLFTKGEGE